MASPRATVLIRVGSGFRRKDEDSPGLGIAGVF
jgi:hypothetical protein